MSNFYSQTSFDIQTNLKYETLYTLANGYRGLRGKSEFHPVSLPGNYITGLFNQKDAQVNEMVNLPDPLIFNIYIEDELIDADHCQVSKCSRDLDPLTGTLFSRATFTTPSRKMICIESERFVSSHQVHRWAVQYKITPLNFKGKIIIENMISGLTLNNLFNPFEIRKHYAVSEILDLDYGIGLKFKTLDQAISGLELTACCFKQANFSRRKFSDHNWQAREVYEMFVEKGCCYEIDKLGVTYNSNDHVDDLNQTAVTELQNFIQKGYQNEKQAHEAAWEKVWDKIDIKIGNDEKVQEAVRFNLFHLMSCKNKHNDHVSIGGKGLHGEGYLGHVFWDTELFMLPFFTYTQPEIARSLLLYRYHTLNGARKNAAGNHFKGAQFGWESAIDGSEETPKWGIDYVGNQVRIWNGEEELHINCDIVIGILEYYRATQDVDFLINYGIEIILNIAQFWASRLEYNEKLDRYELNKVIGPDEFHDHVNNNFYTNYIVRWSLEKCLQLKDFLKEKDDQKWQQLCQSLELDSHDFENWRMLIDKIYIPRPKDEIFEQFEGYFALKDLPITQWDQNGMPCWPEQVDLAKVQETTLVKQPDVVMLLFLLNNQFDFETKKKNYQFYEKRTMHKSSLSPSIYSIVGLAVHDYSRAYDYLTKTLMVDIMDNQQNAYLGLHAASCGGAWQSLIYGFGGFSLDENNLPNLNPWLPEKWTYFQFKLTVANCLYHFYITKNEITVKGSQDCTIKIKDKEYSLQKEKEIKISY